jgi:hypothetical protein
MNIEENQVRPNPNGTHQPVASVYDVNLPGGNIDTIKTNSRTLSDSSEEVGLEKNLEETKYMLLSSHQTTIRNSDIKIGNTIGKCVQIHTKLKKN